MYLKNIKIENFKNYNNLSVNFSPHINVVFGKNAQGKTNLIEAIYFLSTLTLLRNLRIEEVVRKDTSYCSIKGSVVSGEISKDYEVSIFGSKREQTLNNKKIHKMKEYFGDFFSIAYTQSNINLVDGNPSSRRKYFDRSIFNHNVNFLDEVKKYNKIVSERNYFFKNHNNKQTYEIYTEMLFKKATNYIFKRLSFINKINKIIKEIYFSFLKINNEVPEIFYSLNGELINNVITENEINNKLKNIYETKKEEEFIKRKTLFGPHLDDLIFHLSDISLKKFASQGQKKSFLLALKLSELELLREKKPIFLIDDFTSELDEKRREALIDYINNNQHQSFITTTNINYLPDQNSCDFRKYQVDRGTLIC